MKMKTYRWWNSLWFNWVPLVSAHVKTHISSYPSNVQFMFAVFRFRQLNVYVQRRRRRLHAAASRLNSAPVCCLVLGVRQSKCERDAAAPTAAMK